MAQVPYRPTPEQRSSEAGVPYQSVPSATPEAFGAGEGRAMQGFGQQVERLGDVLEKHAIRMQGELNVAAATELDSAFNIEMGEAKAKFNTLEGKARAEAFPAYIRGLEEIRAKHEQTATNGEVRRMFNQDSKRRVSYSISEAASSAASATRDYVKKEGQAAFENSRANIGIDPRDDVRFETEKNIMVDRARTEAQLHGLGEEGIKAAERHATSVAWATRIQTEALAHPWAAKKWFEEHRKEFDPDTEQKLRNQVRNGINLVGAADEAKRIVAGQQGVEGDLYERIKKFEGFRDKAYWDHKQWSIGHGTKASGPDEKIDRAGADVRLREEVDKAAAIVDQVNPNMPKGTRDALISLTYNAGPGWINSGLGQKIKAGDFEGAKENFSQYVKASGTDNAGLVSRRAAELSWWGGEKADGPITAQTGEGQLPGYYAKAAEAARRVWPDDEAARVQFEHSVINGINTDFNLKKKEHAQQRTALSNDIYGTLNKTMPTGRPPATLAEAQQLDPMILQKIERYREIDPHGANKFLNEMNSNAKRDNPWRPEMDNTFKATMGLAPEKLADVDAAKLFLDGQITMAQKNQILRAQTNAAKHTEATLNAHAIIGRNSEFLRGAGISASANASNAEKERFEWLSGAVILRTREWQADNPGKKKMTPEEERNMMRSLLEEVVTSKGRLWDSTVPRYERESLKEPVPIEANTPQEAVEKAKKLRPGQSFTYGGKSFTRD